MTPPVQFSLFMFWFSVFPARSHVEVIQRLDALAQVLNISRESPTSNSEPLSSFSTSWPLLLPLSLPSATNNICDHHDNQKIEVRVSHGTVLKVSQSTIPDPPLVLYAKDIAKLNWVWDDSSPFWSPEEVPFQIEGIPVALVYWKELYAYGKTGHWKGTKSKWADWKVSYSCLSWCSGLTFQWFVQSVVECYCKSSTEDFWAEFSDKGMQLSFTAIVSRLCEQRKVHDEQVAAQAIREHGPITYHQGSQHAVTMCKPYAIAKAYHCACHKAT